MRRDVWARRAAIATLLALSIVHLTCAGASLTAPNSSTISVFANPPFIASNGGVSVITAVITEPAGTAVPDGTVVQFFTTLGTIDREGKTHDGVARVNLISDSRSGAADVTASSGSVVQLATALVTIGSVRSVSVVVTANPPAIDGLGPARQSRIVANVFDASGNPVVSVPAIFSVVDADTGNPSTEFMASGGAPVFTDSNGQAVDFLQTRYPRDAECKNVTVTATTTNGIAGTVNVVINSKVPPCTPIGGPDAPKLDSFTPTMGAAGTPVTITGSMFTGATSVNFNGTSASFSVDSDTEISTSVPVGATTGPITVTTDKGTGTSTSDFTVTSGGPIILSFAPTMGPVGTPVTLMGTGFTGANNVSFNGTSATFMVDSDMQISTSVPAGATTGPISVTTPEGTGESSSDFTVTSGGPIITSFNPTMGPVGTPVTITGTGFTGATDVAFNGTSATFTLVSDTQIDTTVPVGATDGPISVTTPQGTGVSSSDFDVTP